VALPNGAFRPSEPWMPHVAIACKKVTHRSPSTSCHVPATASTPCSSQTHVPNPIKFASQPINTSAQSKKLSARPYTRWGPLYWRTPKIDALSRLANTSSRCACAFEEILCVYVQVRLFHQRGPRPCFKRGSSRWCHTSCPLC
jgi:hypothetical protein